MKKPVRLRGEPKLKVESVQGQTSPGDVIPHVGHALDGSQLLNVVEEQQYANQSPSREERLRQHEKI